jgi:hypothetical protein
MMNVPKENMRRKSFIWEPFAAPVTPTPVISPTTQLAKILSNRERDVELASFRKILLNGILQENRSGEIGIALENTEVRIGSEEKHEYVYTLSSSVTDWLLNRHTTLISYLKDLKKKTNPIIEGYNLTHQVLHGDIEHAQKELWKKYTQEVENNNMKMPSQSDINHDMVQEITSKAIDYYEKEFNLLVQKADESELISVAYSAAPLSAGVEILTPILNQMRQKVTPEKMRIEIFPTLCLKCCTSKKQNATTNLAFLIKSNPNYLTPDLINSMLEYSSHSICGHSIYTVILEPLKDEIITQGILCAFMVSVLRGQKQLATVFQFVLTEKLGSPLKATTKTSFSLGDSPSETNLYIPPFIYICFGIAAQTNIAQNSVIGDLIHMYDEIEIKSQLLAGGINSEKHLEFMEGVFYLACRLNNQAAVLELLDSTIVESDLVNPIYHASRLGNQKILQMLLESLLAPDSKVNLPYGAIPLIFRKPGSLKLLPFIAVRYPTEARWFVNQLSNIPIPLAVPPAEGVEPTVGSKWIGGLSLGIANLTELISEPDFGIPNDIIWEKVNLDGQLRKVSKKAQGTETACVICMIPDIMAVEREIQEQPSKSKLTNPLIRLLDTEDEEIILSPMVQALVEYHWVKGYFWIRFGVQFSLLILFITSTTIVFCNFSDETFVHLRGVAIAISVLFLAQEFRQYLDNKQKYLTSLFNAMDIFIYCFTIAAMIADYHIFPALLKALVVIFSTIRLLIHLRIIPSVGPIIRITSSALLNVVPILVPIILLTLSFAGAFYIAHQEIIGKNSIFSNFWRSLQFTLTMITFDYT